MTLLDHHPGDRRKSKMKNGTLVVLAHAVIGMFNSVDATQRQPQYIIKNENTVQL